MPVYEATRQKVIAASARELFDVLTDFEHIPEWQGRVKECRVLSRDERGRAGEVEYAIDAILRTVRYRVRHVYEEPEFIGSEYLGGDFRCFEGSYRFAEVASGEGTEVSFHLRIDPGLRVPGRIARMLNESVMGRALEDLERRVREVGATA